MKKRMGLFVFYDKDNIVDDYILYLLEEISKELSGMVIISNSKLSSKEKSKLNKYCFKYIERENKGLDAGALCDYFRNNNDHEDYDEIVYFNDTCYAPLYPFNEIFKEMDEKKCDFWGLTVGEKETNYYEAIKEPYFPKHIQTFFIVFRKNVFLSDAFKNYWKNFKLEEMKSFNDIVSKHELIFTKYLEDNGFKYDYYIKSKVISDDYHRNYNHFAFSSANLVIDEKAPFIKRKCFITPIENLIYMNANNDLKRAYLYIKNNTNYDTKMIWQNVLRLYNIYDVSQVFGLNEIIIPNTYSKYSDVSYFIIIDNLYILDKLIDKINNIHGDFKLYTKTDKIYSILKDLKMDVKKYNSNLMNLVLEDMKKTKSEYIGFFNFKDDTSSQVITNYSDGETILDNILDNNNYVEEIINRIKDENISMAYAPNTYVKDEFKNEMLWDKKIFDLVKSLVPDYKLLDISKNPVSQREAWIAKNSLLNHLPKNNEIIEDELFSKVLSIAIGYYGVLDSKYPIIVSNLEFSNYYLSLQGSIIDKSFTSLRNNKEDYSSSFIGSLTFIRKSTNGKEILLKGIKRRIKKVIKKR